MLRQRSDPHFARRKGISLHCLIGPEILDVTHRDWRQAILRQQGRSRSYLLRFMYALSLRVKTSLVRANRYWVGNPFIATLQNLRHLGVPATIGPPT